MSVLIRLPDVIKKTTLSRSRIYAHMDAGKFPRPIKIGDGAVAWRESDIDQWIDKAFADQHQQSA